MTICDNQGSYRPGAGPAEIVKLVKLPLLIADESPLAGCWPPAPCPALCSDARGEVYS